MDHRNPDKLHRYCNQKETFINKMLAHQQMFCIGLKNLFLL